MPPSSIEAIVLTHAHLDHCGYLPRLVAQGFKGRIFCTQGTQDLCRIVLPDAGRIQEEDAEYANRRKFSKHTPALPLYREVDALRAVSQLQPVGYDRADAGREGHRGRVRQRRPPARILVRADERSTAGRSCSAATSGVSAGRCCRIRRWPTEADYLLVESTYGDRVHEQDDNGVTAGADRQRRRRTAAAS